MKKSNRAKRPKISRKKPKSKGKRKSVKAPFKKAQNVPPLPPWNVTPIYISPKLPKSLSTKSPVKTPKTKSPSITQYMKEEFRQHLHKLKKMSRQHLLQQQQQFELQQQQFAEDVSMQKQYRQQQQQGIYIAAHDGNQPVLIQQGGAPVPIPLQIRQGQSPPKRGSIVIERPKEPFKILKPPEIARKSPVTPKKPGKTPGKTIYETETTDTESDYEQSSASPIKPPKKVNREIIFRQYPQEMTYLSPRQYPAALR